MTESGSLKVLLEEMNDKFSLVLEGHDAIRQEFKDSHKELEEKMNLNSSLIKFGFETLETKTDGVRIELRETHEELSAKIEAVGTELKDEMAAGFKSVGAKVNRASERESALGQKVEGHEDRVRFLERKSA